MASSIEGQGSDVPELLVRDGKCIIQLTYSQLKEIADRYGIGIEECPKGESGFIIDDSGKVYKELPLNMFNFGDF